MFLVEKSLKDQVENILATLEERISILSTVFSSILLLSSLLSILSSLLCLVFLIPFLSLFPLLLSFLSLSPFLLFSLSLLFSLFPFILSFILIFILKSQTGMGKLIQLKKELKNAKSSLAKIAEAQGEVKISSEKIPVFVKWVKVFLPPSVVEKSLEEAMTAQETVLADLLDQDLPPFPPTSKLLDPIFRFATRRVAWRLKKLQALQSAWSQE